MRFSEKIESEKRSSLRCPISSDAMFHIENGFPPVSGGFQVRAVDLGEGGIGLLSKSGKIDEIKSSGVKLSFSRKPTVELKGRIVWTSETERPGQYRCGFQFDEIDLQQLLDLKIAVWPDVDFITSYVEAALRNVKLADDAKDEIRSFFSKEVRNFVHYMIQLNTSGMQEGYSMVQSQKIFDGLCNRTLEEGFKIVEKIDSKVAIMSIKNLFRNIVGPWVYQGIIVRDAFLKPRGYPGDYRTIERIYDNKVISPGVGEFSERYFLKNDYAGGVQRRKDRMREILSYFLRENRDGAAKILNIACGSCREVKELFSASPETGYEVTFTCVDHDEETLSFVRKHVDTGRKGYRFRYIRDDIINFTRDPKKYLELFGQQDLIYSIGLVDYLPDRVLKQLLGFLYTLVLPKGKLVITHKDREIGEFSASAPDWFCDWKFVPRNKNEICNLIVESGLKDCSINSYYLPSSPMLFLEITRR